MNMTVLILEKCYNTGNYTSMRVGGEWAIQEGEDLAVSARLASIQCDRMFAEAQQASKEEAEKAKKEAEEHAGKTEKKSIPMPISVDDSRFAYCLRRLREGVSLEEMTSKVSFDAVALDTLVAEERKLKEQATTQPAPQATTQPAPQATTQPAPKSNISAERRKEIEAEFNVKTEQDYEFANYLIEENAKESKYSANKPK